MSRATQASVEHAPKRRKEHKHVPRRMELALASPEAHSLRAPAQTVITPPPLLEPPKAVAVTPAEMVRGLIQAEEAENAQETAALFAEALGRSRFSMFKTSRGLLHLEELSDQEAQRLANAGKLSLAEVEEWGRWRQRRHLYPRETRYELFLLRARRFGVSRISVFYDGSVVWS